jgi:hypothetical protein
MLLGLLSGIRDARSPLIVGYVVMLALWLLLFHALPEGHTALHKHYPELATIFDKVGPVGLVAASSFVAYLAGDLVVRESARLLQIRGQPPIESSTGRVRQAFRKIYSFTHDAEMDELNLRVKELVERTMVEAKGDDPSTLSPISTSPGKNLKALRVRQEGPKPPADALPIDEQVLVEAKSGRIDERILAAKPELYSELYRLRSEAEFRAGLLPALFILAVAAAIRTSWPWWLYSGLGVAFAGFEFLLLNEAFQLRTRARGIALRAVVDELVTTPTLDAIRRDPERVYVTHDEEPSAISPKVDLTT